MFFIILVAFVVAACRPAAVARDCRDQPFPRVDACRIAPTVLLTLSLDACCPCGCLFLIVAFYASIMAATVAGARRLRGRLFFYCCILCICNGGHGGHDRDHHDHCRCHVDDTTINRHVFFLAYSRGAYLDFASEQVKD